MDSFRISRASSENAVGLTGKEHHEEKQSQARQDVRVEGIERLGDEMAERHEKQDGPQAEGGFPNAPSCEHEGAA